MPPRQRSELVKGAHNSFTDALSRYDHAKGLDARRREKILVRAGGLVSNVWRGARSRIIAEQW